MRINKLGRKKPKHVFDSNRPQEDYNCKEFCKLIRAWETAGRMVGVRWCHVPNGGKRTQWEGVTFKAMGVQPGWPDYQFERPNGDGTSKIVYVEMKGWNGGNEKIINDKNGNLKVIVTPYNKGELSSTQLQFEHECKTSNTPYIAAWYYKDALDFLIEHGIIDK